MCIHLYINLRGYDAPITPYARPLRVIPNPQPQLQDDHGPGRKASISREDLMAAALKLVGPHRSVSPLGLRERARGGGIAPNSF